MDTSPSPHHLELLNQEDKAASTAGEGVHATGQALPATSLLDLPDELVTAIFDQVWQSLRPKRPSFVRGILVPTRQAVINKRIWMLARPIWFRLLITPDGQPDVDRFMANLLVHKDIHPFVRTIDLSHPDDFPSLTATILGFLPNLVSLIASFESPTIPPEFGNGLKTLPHLRSLQITTVPWSSFDDFSLDDDLPSLRRLDVASREPLSELLDYGAQYVEHLTMRCSVGEGASCSYPWATLKSLRLKPADGFLDDGNILIVGMRNVYQKAKLPLEHLSLAFNCLSSATADDPAFFIYKHVFAMLLMLQRSHVFKRLDVASVRALGFQPAECAKIRVPSVAVVKLNGTLAIWQDDNLSKLCAFLSIFPSATALHIIGFSFSPPSLTNPDAQTAHTFSSLSPTALAIQSPTLCAFLFFLRTTTEVREVRYRTKGETREMRWIRGSKEEEFTSDCWTLE